MLKNGWKAAKYQGSAGASTRIAFKMVAPVAAPQSACVFWVCKCWKICMKLFFVVVGENIISSLRTSNVCPGCTASANSVNEEETGG